MWRRGRSHVIPGPALLPILYLGRRKTGRTQIWVDTGVVDGERKRLRAWQRGRRGAGACVLGLWDSTVGKTDFVSQLRSWLCHLLLWNLGHITEFPSASVSCSVKWGHSLLGHCGGIPVECLEPRWAQSEWDSERVAHVVAQPRVACKAGIFGLVTQIRRM